MLAGGGGVGGQANRLGALFPLEEGNLNCQQHIRPKLDTHSRQGTHGGTTLLLRHQRLQGHTRTLPRSGTKRNLNFQRLRLPLAARRSFRHSLGKGNATTNQ